MDRHGNDADPRQLPTGELVKQLAEEVSNLVRAEIELARAEVTTKGKRAGIGLVEISVGHAVPP